MRGRGKSRFLGCALAAAVLLAGFAISAGWAMWVEWRNASAAAPVVFGTDLITQVILDRNSGTWSIESVGPLGHNPSFDEDDPDRFAEAFIISGTSRGEPRPWYQTWQLQPQRFRTRQEAQKRQLARSGLDAAIRDRKIPWPAELIARNSCQRYSPWNQFRNGVDRSPATLLPCASTFVVVAALILRGVRRRAPGTCIRCGYPRAGLPPGAACPECGNSQIAT